MKALSFEEARQLVESEAEELVHLLEAEGAKLVLAESCTGGLVSALIAQIPGVSQCFCGSAVAYRSATKQNWLGVSGKSLSHFGPVSEQVTLEMAIHVLDSTQEATIAGSITGHLGPNAPHKLDGVVYTAVAARIPGRKNLSVYASEHRLTAPRHLPEKIHRPWRQLAASHSLLMMVRSLLEERITERFSEPTAVISKSKKNSPKPKREETGNGKSKSSSRKRPKK